MSDYAVIASTWQFVWLNVPLRYQGQWIKWVLCTASDREPLVIAGACNEHKQLQLPEGYNVVGAGDLLWSGTMLSWDSSGYKVYTPKELQEPLKRLLLEKLPFMKTEAGRE